MNLQQRYMKQALTNVGSLINEDEKLKNAYGALCHQIPIYVLIHGLFLTAAFVDAKAGNGDPRAHAFGLARRHLLETLGAPAGTTTLSGFLEQRSDPALQMLDTMTIVDAWAYYKRFAVSILDVEAGEESDETETPQHATIGEATS